MTGAANMNITENDKRVFKFVAKLTDTEIFGLECFLAGMRAAAKEQPQETTTKKCEKMA